MYKRRRIAVAIGAALVLAAQTVGAEEHREHGPHVHGIGHLNVALDGSTLEIELDSPAMNLVGFEHAPHSDAEHKQHDEVIAQLKEGKSLFVFPAAAGCESTSVNLTEGEMGEHEEDHANHHDEDGEEHAHQHEEEGEEHVHSDITVHYHFHCEKPAALDVIDVQLFQRFPATEKLQVQSIGPNGQKGGELTVEDHHLRF